MKPNANPTSNDKKPRSTPLRASVGVLIISLAALAGLAALIGCASTPRGLAREQALYQAGTNIVGQIQSVAPYLPPPISNATEVGLALASAVLAAWNAHQHQAIKKLKNGNGNGNGTSYANGNKASPPTGPPPTALPAG